VRTTLPDGREQKLVREFFGGARSGFFVEVGANRPQQESQTWHLEQLGWTGVLIEPQPDLADDLWRVRSAKVFAVACSSPGNAGRRMGLHLAGALSSLDRDRMAPGVEPERVIEVPVRTLDDILIEARAPTQFDLLSIDVEGHELEVLSGFDFARWRPRLILLEEQRLVCPARRDDRRGATRTLGYRSQILSWPAVPHRAQRVARLAPAAA